MPSRPLADPSRAFSYPFVDHSFSFHANEAPALVGGSIEKDHPFNIDAQDAQDKQDGTLLQERLAPAMIVGELADVRDYKPAVPRKKSCASM